MTSEQLIDVGDFVLFGVSLLLAAIAPYIARMLFGVLVSVKYKGKPLPFFALLQYHMLWPVTLLLIGLFWYIAVFVSFAAYFDTRSGTNEQVGVQVVFYTLYTITLFYFIFVGIFNVWRLAKFMMEIAGQLLDIYSFPPFYQPVVLEFVKIVAYAATIVLGIFLVVLGLSISGSSPETDSTAQSIVSLLGGLNFFTFTLIIGITPFFRDIIAGFTMLGDDFLQPNALVRLAGVSNIGYVEVFGLRTTQLRMLDESHMYVPNSKFLRYTLINYSLAMILECMVVLPIQKGVHMKEIRNMLTDLQLVLFRESVDARPTTKTDMEDPHDIYTQFLINPKESLAVTFNSEFEIVITCKFNNEGLVATKRMQSELMLILTEQLQKRPTIKPRGPTRTVYRQLKTSESGLRTFTE